MLPLSPLRLQVLRLRVRRSASPPGVSHCGLPPAGDLSGLQARHLRTQRRPGLPGPRPAAGELRGPGWWEVRCRLGWGSRAVPCGHKGGSGPFPLQGGSLPQVARRTDGAPVGGARRYWGLTWGHSGCRAETGRASRTLQGEVWVNLSRQ